jgi:hypothetical protein
VYMKTTMEAIKARYSDDPGDSSSLRRTYDDKIGGYPCRSFNLGTKTVTFPHTDNCNLSHSWCSVTPLGEFDHEAGGHLVLWDFGLVVDFPAGSTILIPSSIIVHSNTQIKEDETRFSIVQYVAGGLFRWAENGYSTQAAAASKEGLDQQTEGRWMNSVKMFTKISELVEKNSV